MAMPQIWILAGPTSQLVLKGKAKPFQNSRLSLSKKLKGNTHVEDSLE